MTKTRIVVLGIILVAACAAGYGIPHVHEMVESGAIKTWSTGENLTSTDLNTNFSHIHHNMVGGHGARLIDADVSSIAAIASSKLAAYRMIPVAWATVEANCTAGTCTLASSQGITSIVRNGAGDYTVTMSSTRTDGNYGMFVTMNYNGASAATTIVCVQNNGLAVTTTTFRITCHRVDTGAATDAAFSTLVFDNN